MAAWVGGPPDSVPNLIADGKIRKLEVSVLPSITLDGEGLGLNAVTETFDLEADAIIDNWFKGAKAVVNIDGCNACHDKLGQTFHGSFGVGGEGTDNMLPCRNCHAPTYDGGHFEMASRSIENYVHAIHSFQDFDLDDTFDTYDPVYALRYELHVNHTFPNFTIRNCEACHLPGTYNVPDQSQALPGQLSASYPVNTWYTMVDRFNTVCGGTRPCIPQEIPEQAAARSIGDVPGYVTGPASRACGGCHRADLINDNAAGDLAAFNAHTAAFGTYVEADPDTADGENILFGIIDKIMTWLE
jgi:OmcA/MtrC family decaheme c-type cytochrome